MRQLPNCPVFQKEPEYTLYSHPIKWDDSSLQILNLYRLMDYFNSHDFVSCLRDVYAFELQLKRDVEELGNWDKEYPDWENKEVNNLLAKVTACFTPKEFPQTLNVVVRVSAFANSKCTHQELYMRIVALREAMEDELHGKKLVQIPNLRSEYCDKKDAFGEAVSIAFPSAERDIQEAANCYALGFNTACVFHLMRVLEKGLMALAHSLNVAYTSENWGRILDKIEAAIAPLEKVSIKENPNKLSDLQFYGESATQFRYFKNAWRNHVVHACVNYGPEEALAIMGHVRDLMQSISKRLSE